ncbi:MAG: DUF58 domain-containing protein [Planctomycetota bacterium]|nr:DUF58 domain-containing protein [Planctomycetota bacterium]
MTENGSQLVELGAWLQTAPWLILGLFVVPLLFLARKGIYPHLPILLLGLGPAVLTFGLLVRPDWVLVVASVDAVVLLAATVDLFTLASQNTFTVSRAVERAASIDVVHPVTLQVNNLSSRSRFLWIRDGVPQEFRVVPDPLEVQLHPRSRGTLSYQLRAQRRGAFLLDVVHLCVRSRLRLWKRMLTYSCESTIHVYPDLKQLSKYAVLARTNKLSLMGVRRTRKIGQDNDYERLRDFTRDDNYRHIDWRSTARRNKLTVKDFQSSQSQRVIFLLDCGRMMTNQSAGLSLLDHTLNSMLMLSHVALRQGDSVGLLCFSDCVHTYVPPRGGRKQMNQLMHAVFDRFPKLTESRYDEAFLYLNTHCKKRSLVILVTNLIDEVNSHQIEQYLGNVVGRHLALGVLLRDHRLFDAADVTQPTGRSLYTAAAAAEILTWRHQVLTDLEHRGVLSLDVFPEDMTAPLLNRYLDIKARHLL